MTITIFMGNDFLLVLRWWGTLFVIGATAWPLTKTLFRGWRDGGYFFSKAVGMAVVTYIVYLLGILHILPFTNISIVVGLIVVFVIGIIIHMSSRPTWRDLSHMRVRTFVRDSSTSLGMTLDGRSFALLLLEELVFFAALLFWSWIKAHEPSIRGLEKFMDYGFMNSILHSQYFPAPDMWFAGSPINYYYFGHTIVAVLTKLSGIDLAVTFNLMLATIFALTLTMSFSIGFHIGLIGRMRPIGGVAVGLLTSFLVTLAGNMQTIYAFTRGYTGDKVQPFWDLFWPMGEFWQRLPEGMQRYWYANATRFIPFTIHEFPSYSFVVSDVHGHVLSLPFVLLSIGILISLFGQLSLRGSRQSFLNLVKAGDVAIPKVSRLLLPRRLGIAMTQLIFYGFLVAVLLMTNALDGPIYFVLFIFLFIIQHSSSSIHHMDWWIEKGKVIGIVGLTALLTSLPFLLHFKSFVSGLAVNCPPAFLASSKVGPILFEGVEKCQHSPVWMMALLWGFFLYCGGWLIVKIMSSPRRRGSIDGFPRLGGGMTEESTKNPQIEKLLLIFFGFSLLLIVFPEYFYFKDIYPAHFRSNTMFKLGYDAFILFSIVSGYAIVTVLTGATSRIIKIVFLVFLLPQLFLVSIYPYFSVRSYFGELRHYKGIYGLSWLQDEYPSDFEGIQWINQQISDNSQGSPVLIESDGDSYTDYNHFSAFIGMPTVVGWAVHEWLWRGGYDVVSPRREEVRQIYESENLDFTRELLSKHHVRYIIVGTLERKKFTNLAEWKFNEIGIPVFQKDQTVIYEVKRSGS